jgi:drug/metabolite transporter (DMT)-like permease
MSSSSLKTYLIFLLVILLWGINMPMNKIAMQYMPAIWHAAIRLGISCVTVFIVLGMFKKLKIPTKRDLPIILTVGLLQIGIFTTLINFGLNFVDAGRSSMLVYTTPLWATPLAIILFKEKLNYLKTLGLGTGLFGILVLLSPWSIDWTSGKIIFGNCILIGASICMAISILSARNLSWSSSPIDLLPWQLLVGTLPTLAIAFLTDPNPTIEWNSTSTLAMAYTAVLATSLGNGGLTIISKNLPSINVSLGLLGVPLTSIISSAFILNERVSMTMKFAMIFIFVGLICIALSSKVKKPNPLVHAKDSIG